MFRQSTTKVVGFNILALGALAVGLFCHYVQPIFLNDKSYLTYVIAATMLSIVIASVWDSFKWTNWAKGYMKFQESNLRILGLIGTLVGLVFLIGVIGDAVAMTKGSGTDDMIPKVLTAFTEAMRTSFNPTLAGITAWYWCRHLLYFKRND